MLYRKLVTEKGRFTTLGRRVFRLPRPLTWAATSIAILIGFLVLYGLSGSHGAPGFPALDKGGNAMYVSFLYLGSRIGKKAFWDRLSRVEELTPHYSACAAASTGTWALQRWGGG
jgi:hypothetical protein